MIRRIAALDVALRSVRDWSVAIDGGANCGLWTEALAQGFARVHAFEPAADMAEFCRGRFKDRSRVIVHQQALWNETALVSVVPHPDGPEKTRWRFVRAGGDTEAVAIDDLNLPWCGLIKLDLEGAEMLALRGAVETLKRCHPVVIVECKERLAQRFNASAEEPGAFLAKLGAREVGREDPDRIYAWT